MIRVLIVEDSAVVTDFLIYILTSDPEIEVVGTVSDGESAIYAVRKLKPDIITMDINLPKMDGFEATRQIMEEQPTPIIIVSGSIDPKETQNIFKALEAGALAIISRPTGIGHPTHEITKKELIQMINSCYATENSEKALMSCNSEKAIFKAFI
ncbi:MAG: hypothetical protein A2523_11485 [Ignavibacteria bacterium RIFOXYD12_FULL_36_8]|nr:MAG: hypothetical protein A2523_11485 [Ignavibacteria bacterium RIFOXYD12_FULL_36_8]